MFVCRKSGKQIPERWIPAGNGEKQSRGMTHRRAVVQGESRPIANFAIFPLNRADLWNLSRVCSAERALGRVTRFETLLFYLSCLPVRTGANRRKMNYSEINWAPIFIGFLSLFLSLSLEARISRRGITPRSFQTSFQTLVSSLKVRRVSIISVVWRSRRVIQSTLLNWTNESVNVSRWTFFLEIEH